jgi:DNA-binding CsgD family transcriptional regulator
MGGSHPRAGSQRVPKAARDQSVIDLAAMGIPTRKIADKVGTSHSTVARIINRHLQELQTQIKVQAGQIRASHLLELRMLRRRLAAGIGAGDVKNVVAWIRLQEREAKLLGLDLTQPAAEEAASHHAARALLDQLGTKLSNEEMDRVIGILCELNQIKDSDAE